MNYYCVSCELDFVEKSAYMSDVQEVGLCSSDDGGALEGGNKVITLAVLKDRSSPGVRGLHYTKGID